MFGPKLNTIFASRWKALWWAAGVMMLVWSVVPKADEVRVAANADVAASHPAHKSPWDK